MNSTERLLYHQIHPVKLLTDVGSALVATVLFWGQRPIAALAVGFLPSIIVSVVLIRFADLERYRASRFGNYVRGFMTWRVEAARFAGLIPLWGGAWLRRPALIALGAIWILGCWLIGFRVAERA